MAAGFSRKADMALPPRYMRAIFEQDTTLMSGQAGDQLDHRRRRARFRAWHRGMRETDLVLGGFADREIETLSEEELAQFEALLEVQDQMILDWLTGRESVAAEHDTAMFGRILEASRQVAGQRDR
jgi:antitoxin CptB